MQAKLIVAPAARDAAVHQPSLTNLPEGQSETSSHDETRAREESKKEEKDDDDDEE